VTTKKNVKIGKLESITPPRLANGVSANFKSRKQLGKTKAKVE